MRKHYQNNAYEVTSRGIVAHPDGVLVKTKTRSLYTSKVISITNSTSWGKRPLCMGSAFLGKYASVTVVDLIQQKKLDFHNFYDNI